MALITVILPTWNRAHFLREALFSLRLQTLSKSAWRVVVLDNASTDDTQRVVREFSDLQLVYDRSPTNIGVYANFERGFRNYMDSEFFAMLCDDDLYAPYFLQTALAGIQSHNDAGMFSCGAIFGAKVGDFHRGLCDTPGGLNASMTADQHHIHWSVTDWLALHSATAPVILPSCLFRTASLREISPVFSSEVACSDRWMLAQFGERFPCYSTPWPATLIRFHSENGWLHLDNSSRIKAERHCSDLVLALCQKHNIDVVSYWVRLGDSIQGLPERLKHHIHQNYCSSMSRRILGDWEPDNGVLARLKIPARLRPALRSVRRLLSQRKPPTSGD